MRRLRARGGLLALVVLGGVATGCGSVPGSSAGTAAAGTAAAGSAAAGSAAAGTAAKDAGATASQTPGGAVAPAGLSADDRGKKHGSAIGQKPTFVKHADLLNGVSCTGTRCVAVGAWYYGVKSEHTLVELWTGKAWSLEPSPDEGKYSALGAVSCAASAGCVALGTPTLTGYGSHWRAVAAPSDLTAVSCTSADACVAVGTQTPKTPVFAIWNGTTWRAGTMQAVPSQAEQVTIAGVSCAAADNCVAVGDYAYGISAQPSPGYRDKTLAEHWNGRGWRLLPTVNVSHSNALTAVSCVSPRDCTALAESQSTPLGERWNGTTWRISPIPGVSSIDYVQLTGVSCVSADFCVASGTQQGEPIAESWDGGKWRLTHLPRPAVDNHSAQLTGVSCASARSCAAVGIDGAAGGYAERYIAGRWELSAMVNPQ